MPIQRTTITIADDMWDDDSGDYPPGSRLLGTLQINETMFHLDAREIITDEYDAGYQRFVAWDEDNDPLYNVFGGDGPWMTTRIAGRDYVVFAHPYCN